jgi:hypothetical protein
MSRSQSRQLGSACRIYKNSAGKVIAVDYVAVNVDKTQIQGNNKFHVSVNSIDVDRKLLHLTVGGSRVVSTIMMIGDYSSIQENSGNFFIAQWNAGSADENDVQLSFESKVAKIGDTV